MDTVFLHSTDKINSKQVRASWFFRLKYDDINTKDDITPFDGTQ